MSKRKPHAPEFKAKSAPKDCERVEDLRGAAGRMKALKIKLMKRTPGADLTAHPQPDRALRRKAPRYLASESGSRN